MHLQCGFGPQEPVESDLIPKDVGLSACGQPCKTVSDCHPLCHNAQCVSGKCSPTKRPIHPVTARLEERQYSGDGNKLCTTQADCKGVPFTHCLGGEVCECTTSIGTMKLIILSFSVFLVARLKTKTALARYLRSRSAPAICFTDNAKLRVTVRTPHIHTATKVGYVAKSILELGLRVLIDMNV